ncbi:MAG: hypothetical protein LBL58_14780 [Tannerellaceae bacterium]|nr:hypothetical protein [Tannerellaceae bacterium]
MNKHLIHIFILPFLLLISGDSNSYNQYRMNEISITIDVDDEEDSQTQTLDKPQNNPNKNCRRSNQSQTTLKRRIVDASDLIIPSVFLKQAFSSSIRNYIGNFKGIIISQTIKYLIFPFNSFW